MKALDRRLTALEAQLASGLETEQAEEAAHLAALDELLGQMDKAQKIAWIEAELADTPPGLSGLAELLTDWRDFLNLKGTKTWPDFDHQARRFVENDNSRRWGEILSRWDWYSWTGYGLPPQLRPEEL